MKEISARVKALKRIRDFLEDIFGMENEGHARVDEYRWEGVAQVVKGRHERSSWSNFRLAKIRMDVMQWEVFISECYLVLRAMREPVDMLGTVYQVHEF